MGIMKVDDLEPGMVTSAPILTQRDQLIIDENVILTKQLIARMHFYGITEASILDVDSVQQKEEPPKEEKAAPPVGPDLAYSQKVRRSESFQQFQINYSAHISDFNKYLKDFGETKELHYAKELTEIPSELVSRARTSIAFFDMIHNLRTIDDPIYAHSLNVAMISRMLGKWLKMTPDELDILTLAASLHDIGKFLVPAEVLNKEEKLSDEEFEMIKQHPVLGHEILKDLDVNYHVKQAALMHHERCDGTGYPLGLKMDEIDRYAQIIAIADVYDAMTAIRKYRAPLCPFQVISEFEKDGLSKYNPKFILTFLQRIANTYQNNRVLLSDGRGAKIILLNQNHLSKPMIQLMDGTCLDLSREPGLYIKSVV